MVVHITIQHYVPLKPKRGVEQGEQVQQYFELHDKSDKEGCKGMFYHSGWLNEQ